MNIRNELIKAIDALDQFGAPYAVCGGLAVVIHGYTRMTDDIDMLVPKDCIAQAKAALKMAGFGYVNPSPITFKNARFPITVHRVIRFEGEEHLTVDLIEVTEELAEIWKERETYQWEGRKLSVVSKTGLYHMKRNAGRLQDLADIEHLRLADTEQHES